MDKNRNTIPQKETEDMLKEKTNQDFNNQKPNLKKEQKGRELKANCKILSSANR